MPRVSSGEVFLPGRQEGARRGPEEFENPQARTESQPLWSPGSLLGPRALGRQLEEDARGRKPRTPVLSADKVHGLGDERWQGGVRPGDLTVPVASWPRTLDLPPDTAASLLAVEAAKSRPREWACTWFLPRVAPLVPVALRRGAPQLPGASVLYKSSAWPVRIKARST